MFRKNQDDISSIKNQQSTYARCTQYKSARKCPKFDILGVYSPQRLEHSDKLYRQNWKNELTFLK